MRLRYSNPRCPKCQKEITLLQSLRFWNPWNFKCPHCVSALEYPMAWKVAPFVVALCGVVLGVVARHFEATGQWTHADTLTVVLWSMVLIVVLGLGSWPFTRFKPKHEAA